MGDFLRSVLVGRSVAEVRFRWLGGVVLSAIGATSTFGVFSRVAPEHYPQYRLALCACAAFFLFLAIWFVAREIYFRWGKGQRIGVIFSGVAVQPEELSNTRRAFEAASNDKRLPTRVHLKLLPHSVLERPGIAAVRKRFGLRAVYVVTISQSVKSDKPEDRVYHIKWTDETITQAEDQFQRDTFEHLAHLGDNRPDPQSLDDIFAHQGATLSDILVGAIGVSEFLDENYLKSSEWLAALDERIRNRFTVNQNPRHAFRFLHRNVLLVPGIFPADKPPGPDALEAAIRANARAIALLGEDFPETYASQARNLYYAQRLPEAIGMNDVALQRVTAPKEKARTLLNAAVLCLCNHQYGRAAEHFTDYFRHPNANDFDWVDLIAFADTAVEFGHTPAVFMRALYRKVGTTDPVPPQIEEAMRAWLNEDNSRAALRQLYLQAPRYKRPNHPPPIVKVPRRFKKRR